jgi:hypothetical protein
VEGVARLPHPCAFCAQEPALSLSKGWDSTAAFVAAADLIRIPLEKYDSGCPRSRAFRDLGFHGRVELGIFRNPRRPLAKTTQSAGTPSEERTEILIVAQFAKPLTTKATKAHEGNIRDRRP